MTPWPWASRRTREALRHPSTEQASLLSSGDTAGRLPESKTSLEFVRSYACTVWRSRARILHATFTCCTPGRAAALLAGARATVQQRNGQQHRYSRPAQGLAPRSARQGQTCVAMPCGSRRSSSVQAWASCGRWSASFRCGAVKGCAHVTCVPAVRGGLPGPLMSLLYRNGAPLPGHVCYAPRSC